jgi:hypothetical protein
MGNFTCAQLVAIFQAYVNAAQATKARYQEWRGEVQAEHAAAHTMVPHRSAVKTVLEGRFGKTSTKLMTYGFEPAKTPVRTTASKTVAVAKAEATREARGTKGKKQKKSIKGNVTGVIITPVTSGAPAPVTAPEASSAPANGSAPAAPASPAGTGTPQH